MYDDKVKFWLKKNYFVHAMKIFKIYSFQIKNSTILYFHYYNESIGVEYEMCKTNLEFVL